MRILTVRQPYAWAIIHGGKDVENRSSNIAGGYRGPVAIHAGLAYDDDAALWMPGSRCPDRESVSLAYGAIIGVVDLVDVHSASVIGGCGRMQHDCDEHPNGCRHHCSPWAMGPAPKGWYQHLVLANPRPLLEPLPYTGALGLRHLDPETVLAITRQIGRVS